MLLARTIFFFFIFFIQWYFYQAYSTVFRDSSEIRRVVARNIYFIVSGILLAGAAISLFYPFPLWPRALRLTLGSFMLMVLLPQIIGIIFLIPDDIIRLFRFALSKFFSVNSLADESGKITRLKFFSYLSVFAAAIPGIGLLYGYFKGGYDYRIHRVKLHFPNLPEGFNGFKIVQISDIHTGSFISPTPLAKAFKMINDEKPDVVFFTGDLVNDLAQETEGFEYVFKSLKAQHGVFSIFGNHDYADYAYPGDEGKIKRIESQEKLKKAHADFGWNLLLNEHDYINVNGEQIAIIGVENWDARARFSKYGNMKKAIDGMIDTQFKILLSHSPSHWEAKILKEHNDIDLTLSGHTHGMQFGIEIPGIKWSPVKYLYKQWAGLYKQDNQYLYVNRGLGFIGYNGRLGIWPEITVIELHKGKRENAEA